MYKFNFDMTYFYIALFCTIVFLVQFILSFFIGDLDLDTDFDIDSDGNSDFSLSDILSFKGLLHFGLGFSWTMWFNHDLENKYLAALISVCVGLLFVFVLWAVYYFAMKLECEMKSERGNDLIGRDVTIYLYLGRGKYSAYVVKDGSKQLIHVYSDSRLAPGDVAIIKKFENGIYFI